MKQQEADFNIYFQSGRIDEAFQWIVEQYSERLYWHIRRFVHFHEDADDCLQEVFLKVWKNLEQFRGKSSIYTWIYRIATNEALAFIKKKKRMTIVSDQSESGGSILEQQLKADPYFDGDELQIKLLEAIDQLPEKQKTVFLMRYFEEMKYHEISEVLGTSVGGLKTNFHRAVQKVEHYLKEQIQEL